MLKKTIISIFISLALLSPLYSGGMNTEKVQDIHKPLFMIRNVKYIIEGTTKEIVLSHYLGIEKGMTFVDKQKLLNFIADKLQLIQNQRTIAEGRIEKVLTADPEDPGKVFVDLEVHIKDTWNYILLPYAKFDSNEGFLLSLRGRNYNFLGGMEELSGNLDYLLTTSKKSEYSLNGGFSFPFFLWDYKWEFRFLGDVTVSPDMPVELNTSAGFSVFVPMGKFTWEGSLDQYFHLNEDGESDTDGYYMKTIARLGSSVKTGASIPLTGELYYSPALVTNYAFKPFGKLSEARKGYELGFEHSFSTGRINWIGNFRDGTEASLDQGLKYNFTRELWLGSTTFDFQFHKAFGWGGFSSRLSGFYLYNSTDEDIGGPIRGIMDYRLDGNGAIFVNLDFPVKVWLWFLEPWFEGHISPFFDYALVKPENGSFSLDKGWYGAGLEGFAFLKAARSIYLRVSLGLDLEALLDGASLSSPAPRDGGYPVYELFIGLGHLY